MRLIVQPVHLSSLLVVCAVLAAIAGLAGLVALWWYSRQTGIGTILGEQVSIVSSDTGAAPSVLLRDPILGLRGRPDYLIEQAVGYSRRLVPVELKPTRRSRRPYESDSIQLGAYILALRATYGEGAADFGYLRYTRQWFRIDLTPELEQRVRALVGLVREGRRKPVVHRSHELPRRCAGCPMRPHCDQALV